MARVDETDPMNQKQIKLVQQVCGKFLYYARAVDCTMLHALNDLATQTHNGIQETMKALTHFLNYCATNPDSVVTHQASDMHDFTQSLGCRIPSCIQSTVTSRRIHLPRQQTNKNSDHQRNHIHHRKNYKISNVICRRIRNRRTIHECTRNTTTTNDLQRIKTSATSNTSENR